MMKMLITAITVLVLVSNVYAGGDLEPSKVWGYVTMKDPANPQNLHLPGLKSNVLRDIPHRTRIQQLRVVFKNPGGAEHVVTPETNPDGSPIVIFPYADGDHLSQENPGAVAIRYEVRFAHYIAGAMADPIYIRENSFLNRPAPIHPAPSYESTPTAVFKVMDTQPYPMIAYDPSQWSFERIEIGSILYVVAPPGMDLEDHEDFGSGVMTTAVVSREPVPIVHHDLPNSPDQVPQ